MTASSNGKNAMDISTAGPESKKDAKECAGDPAGGGGARQRRRSQMDVSKSATRSAEFGLTTTDNEQEYNDKRYDEARYDQKEIKRAQVATERLIDCIKKESRFFASRPPIPMPMFDSSEIQLADIIGEGEFGTVREVKNVTITAVSSRCFKQTLATLKSKSFGPSFLAETDDSVGPGHLGHTGGGSSNSDFESSMTARILRDRLALKERVWRDGRARYAVKGVREDLRGRARYNASLDLASEAAFLASISHPNVIRLRGFVGLPGHPDFLIIMDRLYFTLEQNIEDWQSAQPKKPSFPCGKKPDAVELLDDRILAMYDTARALKFLHQNHLVYRDLKPSNLGIDIRGNVRLFDFGIAKELKECDWVKNDLYRLTAEVGTRRYMAPEVYLGKLYGLKADSYSFGLLFWHVAALEIPFGEGMTLEKHAKAVVERDLRPKIPGFLEDAFKQIMRKCWSRDQSERPSFEEICNVFAHKIPTDRTGHRRESLIRRSQRLRHMSVMSVQGFSATPHRFSFLTNASNSTRRCDASQEISGSLNGGTSGPPAVALERKHSSHSQSQSEIDTNPDKWALETLALAVAASATGSVAVSEPAAWVENELFRGAVRCKMPEAWSDLDVASDYREFWQDDALGPFLQLEIKKRPEGATKASEIAEAFFTGHASTNGRVDDGGGFKRTNQDLKMLELPDGSEMCTGRGYYEIAIDDVLFAKTTVQLEVCAILVPSLARHLVVALTTRKDPEASLNEKGSKAFFTFLESLDVISWAIFEK